MQQFYLSQLAMKQEGFINILELLILYIVAFHWVFKEKRDNGRYLVMLSINSRFVTSVPAARLDSIEVSL